MQHFSVPAHAAHRGRLRGGLRLRRLVDPRVPGDPGVGHDPRARPEHRGHRPVPPAQDANLNCFVRDPVTGEPYSPRPPLRRQEGRGATSPRPASPTPPTSGPRPSSSSSTTCASRQDQHSAVLLRSTRSRASWNTGTDEGPNLGYKPRYKEGYFPVPPMDHYQDLRSEMIARRCERLGIEVEVQHHEVGTAGQAEIDMRFDTLLRMADKLMLYKYVVKNVAWRRTARRPRSCPSRSSRTTARACTRHQSLWKGGEPLFYDETGYAGLSDMARWYIGGLLHHAPAVLAFATPTTNCYKRLVPGYEAPVNLVYSPAQPLGVGAHPAVLEEPEGQAARVPLPRPVVQPVPGVLGDADGRPRRHPEPHRAARPGRQGPLRPAARGAGRGAPGARLARRGARRPRGRPATSSRPAACSPTTSSRPGSPTSASNEVDALRLRPHPWEFTLYYDI